MIQRDIDILHCAGWIIECESPFEIRTKDGSFASGEAAYIVLDYLRQSPPPPEFYGLRNRNLSDELH